MLLLTMAVFLGGISFFAHFSRNPDNSLKSILRNMAGKITGKVYQEAEKHNPEGDVLPDEVDDKIKRNIKESF